jgi:type VI secretion system secreted protein Hcp
VKVAVLLVAVLGLTIFAINSNPAYAAVDMFLKIDGIDGESQTKGHEKEIELESFSWGATMPIGTGLTGGSGTGKIMVTDISVTKKLDSTSPQLLEKLFTGQHTPKVVLTLTKPDGKGGLLNFYKITLEDVLISSYQTGGSSGGDIPIESLSLNFAKITFEYTPQKPDGTIGTPVKFGWDLAKNTKI